MTWWQTLLQVAGPLLGVALGAYLSRSQSKSLALATECKEVYAALLAALLPCMRTLSPLTGDRDEYDHEAAKAAAAAVRLPTAEVLVVGSRAVVAKLRPVVQALNTTVELADPEHVATVPAEHLEDHWDHVGWYWHETSDLAGELIEACRRDLRGGRRSNMND
jgi:hypothetical protein